MLAMGGIPVLKRSSINSCLDSTDNHLAVPVVNAQDHSAVLDYVHRGSIPIVIVNKWASVTTALLESHWAAFVASNRHINHTSSGQWDYSHITMKHWAERIMGLNYTSKTVPLTEITFNDPIGA